MSEGITILVAEDNEALQKQAKRTFENEGFAVIQAFTGADFLRELSRATPDVVVLDIKLPDADGRDLLARMKRDARTASIPVIVWSGRDPESDRRIALELGAEDFVEKGPSSGLVPKIERLLLRLGHNKRIE